MFMFCPWVIWRSDQFATLCWNNKLPQLYIIIYYTDLCDDTDRINMFSIITNSDITRSDKIEL